MKGRSFLSKKKGKMIEVKFNISNRKRPDLVGLSFNEMKNEHLVLGCLDLPQPWAADRVAAGRAGSRGGSSNAGLLCFVPTEPSSLHSKEAAVRTSMSLLGRPFGISGAAWKQAELPKCSKLPPRRTNYCLTSSFGTDLRGF